MPRNTTERGNANSSQRAKEISGASGKTMVRIRAKDRFGGVPINVASPPIEAE